MCNDKNHGFSLACREFYREMEAGGFKKPDFLAFFGPRFFFLDCGFGHVVMHFEDFHPKRIYFYEKMGFQVRRAT